DRVAVLDHGCVQQVGTPQDLYDRPGNVFVAGFIGHPPMNLLEAQLEGNEAVAGSIRIPLPDIGRAHHGRVMLGVKPEDIHVRAVPGLATANSTGARVEKGLAGAVRLVEPTAGQVWVTCEVEQGIPPHGAYANEATILIGVAPGGFHARPGDRVSLSLEGAIAHVFDAKTEARLANDTAPFLGHYDVSDD
ncbi:MAG TPA: hypothetical protein VJ692_06650, partial [Nitrospiraceae bacterium]|nr:hypothetical protein [Nitrospiraceae bacterium]